MKGVMLHHMLKRDARSMLPVSVLPLPLAEAIRRRRANAGRRTIACRHCSLRSSLASAISGAWSVAFGPCYEACSALGSA